MHSLIRAALLIAAAYALPALGQSTVEKAKATGNDVVRATKKVVHRASESLCMGTKVACAAKKVENRINETKDEVVDEAHALKDRVDSDSK